MGSRILSRSFQVEKWDPSANDGGDDEMPQTEMDIAGQSPVEPDERHKDDVQEEHGGDSDDGDGEDDEDSGDVAMVPMADMLNARYGCNNVGNPISNFIPI